MNFSLQIEVELCYVLSGCRHVAPGLPANSGLEQLLMPVEEA